MINCPSCNKSSSGSQYSGAIESCIHCDAALPVSLQDSLRGERDEFLRKAKLVRDYNTPSGEYRPAGEWIAVILLLLSPILIGVGLYQIYGKISAVDKIVGGDAYDFLIYGMRGLAWVGIGLTCAAIACGTLLLQIAQKQNPQRAEIER
ncbi:MAG: hypothetical protein WBV94_24710 [Blastocatellia bacterium]